jgi:hypothetical protein
MNQLTSRIFLGAEGGGEMTQILYAHMNKRNFLKKNISLPLMEKAITSNNYVTSSISTIKTKMVDL